MTSFLDALASPALQHVTEYSFFGNPYIRIGRLFTILGYWAFQRGGLTGYALRDKPVLLAKLAAPTDNPHLTETQILDLLESSSGEAGSLLTQADSQENHFLNLYTVKELRSIGIDLFRWPPDKKLNNKVDMDFTGKVSRLAFLKGMALGFNFPKQFSICWEKSWRMIPDNVWQRQRRGGLDIPEKQETVTLNEGIAAIAQTAISWGESQTPNPLDHYEIEFLQALFEANKFRTFVDKTKRYSISYPATWEFIPYDKEPPQLWLYERQTTVTYLFSIGLKRENGETIPNVFAHESQRTGLTIRQLADNTLRLAKENRKEFQEHSQLTLEIGDRQATILDYEAVSEGIGVRFKHRILHLITTTDNLLYEVIASCDISEWKEYENDLLSAVKSFRILPESN